MQVVPCTRTGLEVQEVFITNHGAEMLVNCGALSISRCAPTQATSTMFWSVVHDLLHLALLWWKLSTQFVEV